MNYHELVELVGKVVEGVGVLVIILGALIATGVFLYKWIKIKELKKLYRSYRQNLGRSILLGLEFLVAGDIIRSIAVPPSLTTVYVLGLIVLIRSFLAIELEMEIEGRWPWQRKQANTTK